MSRIRYLEFRPGRWVKLVDGKVIGPAMPEEVAAWKQEQAEQAQIWEDVLRHTPAMPQPTSHLLEAEKTEPARPHIPEQVPAAAQAGTVPEEFATPPGAEITEAVPVLPQALPTAPETEAKAGVEAPPKGRTGTTVPIEEAAETGPEIVTEFPLAVKEAALETAIGAALPEEAMQAEPAMEVAPLEETVQPALETQAAPYAETAEAEPEAKAVLPTEAEEPKLEAKPAPSEEIAETAPGPEPEEVLSEDTGEGRHVPSTRRALAVHRRASRSKTPPSTSLDRAGQLYLWFMAAPTDDLAAVVRLGLSKYEERFKQPAGVVLCHAEDLPILEKAGLAVDVRQGKGVPAHSFWIGPK
jgi:hypothetical protein